MKKLHMKSKLSMIALAIITVFTISFASVNAITTPDSVTVKRSEVLSDLVTNYDHGFTIFTTKEGKSLYCMDNLKDPLKTGDVAKLVDTADAGILYILENGYPAKHITGNDEMDKYITQAAIWWYLDDINEGSNQLSDEFRNATMDTDINGLVPDYIKPMVAKAKQAKTDTTKPSMKITTSKDKTLKLTNDKKYYESALISASLVKADTYKVTLSNAPKGAVVVDTNGTAKNTFKSGEGLKVKVPVKEVKEASEMSVNLEADGKVQRAKIYKVDSSNYQRVVGLYDDITPIKTSVKLTATPVKKSCAYEDGKYFGKNGNIVDEKTYIIECKKVCEIEDGKYYGKNGEEVDEKTYNKECKNSCEIIDDVYYGKAGDIVDEQTYNEQCKNICIVVNNNYYGNDGNIVDKTTFDAECGVEVVAPNTSSNVSGLGLMLGFLLVASGLGLIIYRSKKSYL